MKTQNAYSTPTGAVVTELADLAPSGKSSDLRSLPTGLDPAPTRAQQKFPAAGNRQPISPTAGTWKPKDVLKDLGADDAKLCAAVFGQPAGRDGGFLSVPRQPDPSPTMVKMFIAATTIWPQPADTKRPREIRQELAGLLAEELNHSNAEARKAYESQANDPAAALERGETFHTDSSKVYETYIAVRRQLRRKMAQLAAEEFVLVRPALLRLRDGARVFALNLLADEQKRASEYGAEFQASPVLRVAAFFVLRGLDERLGGWVAGMGGTPAKWFGGVDLLDVGEKG